MKFSLKIRKMIISFSNLETAEQMAYSLKTLSTCISIYNTTQKVRHSVGDTRSQVSISEVSLRLTIHDYHTAAGSQRMVYCVAINA